MPFIESSEVSNDTVMVRLQKAPTAEFCLESGFSREEFPLVYSKLGTKETFWIRWSKHG